MGRPPDRSFPTEGRVSAGAIEPCGDRIALAFRDGPVEIRGPQGDVRRTLDPGAGPWRSLAFSPDGRRLAGGARDGRLFVADAATGRVLASSPARGGPVAALALSADGGILVAASDGEARIFRVADAVTVFSRPVSSAEVLSVAAAPSGDRAAIGLSDTAVHVVRPDGRAVASLEDLDMAAFALAFSPDGRLLAGACADGAITVRDAATGARVRKDARSGEPLGAVAFSTDGAWVVAVGISMNPATREVSAHVVPVRGDGVTSLALGVLPNVGVGVSADGTAHVVTGDRTGTRMWDVAPPKARA